MTENAKFARLWSKFHRLGDEHKDLIIKITELLREPGKSVIAKDLGKGSQTLKKYIYQGKN